MSGVLWVYGGVVNSQPDNNQEKINPVSHLATIFEADCNLFSTGFGTGIHPSVPRHAMLEKGGFKRLDLGSREGLELPLSPLWQGAGEASVGQSRGRSNSPT